ncbi:MAG: protein-glutamine glutaminase family protein [Sphingopyxis sp.]|uniref:protein-glutamine glutaminase family protein n=1 Tax=Sphingopyxis sp. TaxID=1908224 RepID=UPI002ABAF154|nr:protein-glutamine glutaminase family protein [Sphingopyxis sp.]MDZ3831032.1 protein-glutamine glutaminase family protein [Sphingopyxis sp.]
MRKFVGAAIAAGLCSVPASLPATAQQQRQVPIAQGVTMVSPDAECPAGTVRRVYAGQQQVAQQGFGTATLHYCVEAELVAPKDADAGPPELDAVRSFPTLLPLSRFGPSGTNSDTQLVELTPAEVGGLRDAVTAIAFANYRLSGCHDRAHAAYMLLPAALRAKAVKQWVVAPSAFTRGVRGTIGYPADASVNWRYHVALAFQTPDGIAVFDPTLSPGRLLTEAEWLGSFDYPPLSMRFFAPAETYQFFDEDNDVVELNERKSYVENKDIWVGNGYRYEGTSRANHWIPNNLARDAVGARVEEGRVCRDLQAFKGQPGKLLDILTNGSPIDCPAEKALFDQTRAKWVALLK